MICSFCKIKKTLFRSIKTQIKNRFFKLNKICSLLPIQKTRFKLIKACVSLFSCQQIFSQQKFNSSVIYFQSWKQKIRRNLNDVALSRSSVVSNYLSCASLKKNCTKTAISVRFYFPVLFRFFITFWSLQLSCPATCSGVGIKNTNILWIPSSIWSKWTQSNLSLHSLYYAKACNELAGPISASLRPGSTVSFEEMSQRRRAVGNTLSDLTGPRFNLIRPPAPETSALPIDHLASSNWTQQNRIYSKKNYQNFLVAYCLKPENEYAQIRTVCCLKESSILSWKSVNFLAASF